MQILAQVKLIIGLCITLLVLVTIPVAAEELCNVEVLVDQNGLSLQELSFHLSAGAWQLTAGKQQVHWGPGKLGNLFLSEESPFCGLVASRSWEIGKYSIRSTQLFAPIDSTKHKVLFAHRLESPLTDNLTLGVNESAIASGDFTPWLYNPIPFWPYYLTQHLVKKDDPQQDWLINVNLGIDTVYKWSADKEVYGELFIDDAQSDLQGRTRVPDMFGIMLGFHDKELEFWSNTAATVEYVAITNWVYSHKNLDNNYVWEDETPIGHWLGPDADAITLLLTHGLNPKTDISFKLQAERHGEGSIDEQWKPEYGHENWFLSGVVEKRYTAGISLTETLTKYLRVSSKLDWTRRYNAGNELGKTTEGFDLDIEASLSF
ncbi:MAG: hypothetical protein H0Z38_04415 [Firmicutes bacterium]|nr:hypothetical protein [Bacillota bacterium]